MIVLCGDGQCLWLIIDLKQSTMLDVVGWWSRVALQLGGRLITESMDKAVLPNRLDNYLFGWVAAKSISDADSFGRIGFRGFVFGVTETVPQWSWCSCWWAQWRWLRWFYGRRCFYTWLGFSNKTRESWVINYLIMRRRRGDYERSEHFQQIDDVYEVFCGCLLDGWGLHKIHIWSIRLLFKHVLFLHAIAANLVFTYGLVEFESSWGPQCKNKSVVIHT